jgi:hypothetical protein
MTAVIFRKWTVLVELELAGDKQHVENFVAESLTENFPKDQLKRVRVIKRGNPTVFR